MKDFEIINIKNKNLVVSGFRDLEDKLNKATEKSDFIEINFNNVTYVDSSCIGLLVNVGKILKDKGGLLRVTNLKFNIIDTLNMIGVNKFIEIKDLFNDERR